MSQQGTGDTGKGQPTGSSILSDHADDDDDELVEERERWTGWTSIAKWQRVLSVLPGLHDFIGGVLVRIFVCIGHGLGHCTRRSCLATTKAQKNFLFRQTKLYRFPSPKTGQAEANTGGKGVARHGHVSLPGALASTLDAAKLSR